jgi:flagellar protein FliT
MKTTQEYFAHYEAIAELSARMLAAARTGQWGDLRTMQGTYRELIDGLREVDTGSGLDDTSRARKLELVRRILADDAAIRDLTTPSLVRLSALFTANRPVQVFKKMIGLR